jgi:hypothetical protein
VHKALEATEATLRAESKARIREAVRKFGEQQAQQQEPIREEEAKVLGTPDTAGVSGSAEEGQPEGEAF